MRFLIPLRSLPLSNDDISDNIYYAIQWLADVIDEGEWSYEIITGGILVDIKRDLDAMLFKVTFGELIIDV